LLPPLLSAQPRLAGGNPADRQPGYQAMIVVGRRKGLLVSDARARAGRIDAVVVPVVMAASIGLSWWSISTAMYSWILIAVAPPIIKQWWPVGHARG
jgi:hypothetical protein